MSTVVVSGADMSYRPQFNLRQKADLYKGDMTPYSQKMLEVARHLGYGGLLVFGYSLCCGVGSETAVNGLKGDFDIIGNVYGEPANIEQLFFPKFLKNYMGNYAPGTAPEKGTVTGSVIDDGPQPRLDIRYGSNEAWMGNLFGNGNLLTNFASAHGLAYGAQFPNNIKKVANELIPIALIYGERSGMSSRLGEIIEADTELSAFVSGGLIKVIRIAGETSGHDLGEDHIAYAGAMHEGMKHTFEDRQDGSEDRMAHG
jgi:hypothetical protein